jgi:hypothetical protein
MSQAGAILPLKAALATFCYPPHYRLKFDK